jgi:hypothetical protein
MCVTKNNVLQKTVPEGTWNLGYSSSPRRPITFVQEQKSLRTDYYTSSESFKRFGECCVYRVTSPRESPITNHAPSAVYIFHSVHHARENIYANLRSGDRFGLSFTYDLVSVSVFFYT